MKRFLMFLIMFLLLCSQVWAVVGVTTVSAVTDVRVNNVVQRKIITITWTGDDATGAVTSGTVPIHANGLDGWYLYTVEVDPSAATPDANMTFTLKDSHGLDFAGGIITGTSATVTQMFNVGLAIPGFPILYEDLTFAGTGNTDTTSGGTLILTFTAN